MSGYEFLSDLSEIVGPIFYQVLLMSLIASIIGFVILLVKSIVGKNYHLNGGMRYGYFLL